MNRLTKLLISVLVMIFKVFIVILMGTIFILAYEGIVYLNGGAIPPATAIWSNMALMLGLAVGCLLVR